MAGIDGLVPCGTTGESPTLSADERERLIAATVEVAAERAVARPRPGHRRNRHERHRGDDPGHPPGRGARRGCGPRRRAVLQPARRPDARGPLPGDRRRGRPADRRLQRPVTDRHERGRRHVPAAGDASAGHRGQGGERQPRADRADLPRPARRRSGPCRRRRLDPAVLALGGDGVVSVASNEIPGELAALCAAARAGDWDTARRIHERWLPLFLGNFRGGPNPVPVKAALELMGLLETDTVRGPLLPLDAGRAWPRWPPSCATSVSSKRPAAGSSRRRDTREAVA